MSDKTKVYCVEAHSYDGSYSIGNFFDKNKAEKLLNTKKQEQYNAYLDYFNSYNYKEITDKLSSFSLPYCYNKDMFIIETEDGLFKRNEPLNKEGVFEKYDPYYDYRIVEIEVE